MRALRIVLFSIVIPVLFSLSQQVSRAQGNEPVPGLSVAFGVLALLILVRAAATEWTQGPDYSLQKDVLWGLGSGAVIAVAMQWL